MRVLLIEDEATIAKSIELMLGTEGFNVYTTDLGEEGLDLGKLYDYDIILLDLNLPDMSGYEVLKTLRVKEVMSEPAITISPEATAKEAARLMLEHKIGCLPVVEGHALVGIVTETDILRHVVSF